MKKVSIIIAVFNGSETLDDALESCFEQTYRNKEIIVIDGGSTDDTVEILKKYDTSLAYWVTEADGGIYDAWNKGLKVANGAWVCFIGSDDYWAYPDAIKDLVAMGNKEGADIVSGKVALVDKHKNYKRLWGERATWNELKRHHCVAHPGMLHDIQCYSRIGYYNKRYKIAGDYDFTLRLGSGTKFSYIDKVLVCMGDAGVSNTRIAETLMEVRDIQSRHPEIGVVKAYKNYIVSLWLIKIKKLLGFI